MNGGWKADILPLCPPRIQKLLTPIGEGAPLEEIRLRVGQPVELVYDGYSRLISPCTGRAAVSKADCAGIAERICGHSAYAWEEELREGFVTLPGGYRVGLSGKVSTRDGRLTSVTDIGSLNIRIARACVGAADGVIPFIRGSDGYVLPTLVYSAPGCGKTTLLRDLARQVSGGEGGLRGSRVLVVDERMEITGCVGGIPLHDIGPRTDVLSGCKKPQAFQLAIRGLSPEVIITDELGGLADADAVEDAAFCGVIVVASAHGGTLKDMKRRPALSRLLRQGVFARLVQLGRSRGVGTVECVFDGEGRPILSKEGFPCCAL